MMRLVSTPRPRPGAIRHRPRVLIVDDEPSICRALIIALSRAGFDATAAHSGEHGHELVRQGRFDALVLDLRIPDMRGDVFFHLAVSLQPHLRGHTVFITGDVTERAQTLIDDCQCPLVRKPFKLDEVIAAVAAFTPPEQQASESA
jgi:DNA-binding response OmpR family regulator